MRQERTGHRALGTAQLLGAAFIWGVAFVAQSVGNAYMEPFTFGFVRSFLAVITIGVLIKIFDLSNARKSRKTGTEIKAVGWTGRTLIGGAVCGVFLTIATTLQQFALLYTSTGKCGFITAMYIVMVPVIGTLLGRPAGKKVWGGVFLAVVGLYLLGVYTSGIDGINKGDLLTLGCAFFFSIQILCIDHVADDVDGLKLSFVQFTTFALLSAPFMLTLEDPDIDSMISGWIPVLYMGIMSSGFAYTLQILGQGKLSPTVGSLLMSMESVISAISGWILLGQTLSPVEITGCAVMGAAIVLAQLPDRKKQL